MFKATGILSYDASDSYRLTVEVNHQLAAYYRSLIPKYLRAKPPRWPAHITVVRPIKETPVKLEHWGKYHGEKVEFLYEPYVHFGKMYYWLNILCKELEDIRLELGLPVVSPYTLPPDGFGKYFHCTIANCK
jgi:hypothetical protein